MNFINKCFGGLSPMHDTTKDIFVSHYHADAEKIEAMKALLKSKGFNVRDSSIYEAKAKNNVNNEDYIKTLIRPHITWASTLVVLVGDKTAKSAWVNWEIEAAERKEKRIVGVYLQDKKDSPIPEALNQYGSALVGWNSDSIINAIQGDDTWIGPSRQWDTSRETC